MVAMASQWGPGHADFYTCLPALKLQAFTESLSDWLRGRAGRKRLHPELNFFFHFFFPLPLSLPPSLLQEALSTLALERAPFHKIS